MLSPTVTNDPGANFGADGIPKYLNETLKHVVTSGLKELMQQNPENPIGFLANFVKRSGAAFKDDSFEVTLGGGSPNANKKLTNAVDSTDALKCKMENLCQRQRRGASSSVYKRVPQVPLFGVETPSALELQRSIDAVEAAHPQAKTIHVIVEPPTARDALVFCLGAPFLSDLPEVLERAERNFSVRSACEQKPDSITFNELDCTAIEQSQRSALDDTIAGGATPPPTITDAMKQLIDALGHKRRPQTFADIQASLTSKAKLRYTFLPVEDNYEGTSIHDALDNAIGLRDDLSLLVPVLVVSFRRPRASMYHRILSICAVLLRPLEEVRVFSEVEKTIVECSNNKNTFMYHDYQTYWNKVLDARDRRDKQRVQNEADRKQAIHEARVAAAKEAAAAAAAAADAAAIERGEKVSPHPPLEASASTRYSSKHGSARSLNNQAQQDIAINLPPLPPPKPEEVEARKRLVAARTNRRQQEDSEFIDTLKKTRSQCVARIQRLFRRWRAHARRALIEQELKNSTNTGGNVRPEVEAYREMMQEPPYVGPALLRKAQHRLRTIHGELFSTLPPPPPVPSRRKKFYAPQRARIPAQYEDDVSSEDERWIEHVTIIPDQSQMNRSVFFNTFARLKRCDAAVGNEMLNEALDIQSRFCGVGALQRRAYRQMCFASLDLLHVGYVELAHRQQLPSGCATFTAYIHKFHEDVLTWVGSPHAVASPTSMESDPLPLSHGPEHPLKDRLLYISLDTPAYLPWVCEDLEPTMSIRTSGGPRYLTRNSKQLYFAPEYLDRGRWINAVQHLADDDKHEKISWFSMSEEPYLFINGRAFVLAKRPLHQRVDGELKHLTIEPKVVRTNKNFLSPAMQPSCSAKLTSPVASSPAPAHSNVLSGPGLRSSFNAGPRFSKGSVASQSPQDTGLSLVQDAHEPLSGAATKTFAQFGVSIAEFENAARVEVHQAAVSRNGCVQFCATPAIADLVVRRDVSGVANPHPQPAHAPSQPVSAQPSQYNLTIPSMPIAEGSSKETNHNNDTTLGAGASTVFSTTADGAAGGDNTGNTPQSGSPVRLGSEVFYEGYFMDSYTADGVVVRDWNINPKFEENNRSTNTAAVGGVPNALGNRASADGGVGSFQKSDVGGRSLRRGKLGSRGNLETQSQRRSVADANQRASGNSVDHEKAGAGLNNGAGGHSISFEVVPLVATPHQEASSVGAHDSINKYQLELVRYSIQHCAGPQFLLPYDHFINAVYESCAAGSCVVIAMADESSFFFGATAVLIDNSVRAAKAVLLQSGIDVETSLEMSTPPEEPIPPVVGESRDTSYTMRNPLDVAPVLHDLFQKICAASESGRCCSMRNLTSTLESCLSKSGINGHLLGRMHNVKVKAERATERSDIRDNVRQLCQLVELYTWLVLLQVFLCEFSESFEASTSPSGIVPMPSFAGWLAQPRWEPVVRWMVDFDPWRTEGAVGPSLSPDAHHTQYSNIYKRWAEHHYVSVAH